MLAYAIKFKKEYISRNGTLPFLVNLHQATYFKLKRDAIEYIKNNKLNKYSKRYTIVKVRIEEVKE